MLPKSTSDCGKTSECFRYPENCIDLNCEIIFKWMSMNDSVDFSLAAKIQLADAWLAIGFSNDNKMVIYAKFT